MQHKHNKNGAVKIPEWVKQAKNDGVESITIDGVFIILNNEGIPRFSLALDGELAIFASGKWISYGTTLPESWIE